MFKTTYPCFKEQVGNNLDPSASPYPFECYGEGSGILAAHNAVFDRSVVIIIRSLDQH